MTEERVRNLEIKFRTKSGAFRDFLTSAEMLDLGGGATLSRTGRKRRRIARELHDDTAQNLFGISWNLAKLRQRSSSWTSEHDAGLVSAVQWYVEGFVKRSDIQVELFIEDIGRWIRSSRPRFFASCKRH